MHNWTSRVGVVLTVLCGLVFVPGCPPANIGGNGGGGEAPTARNDQYPAGGALTTAPLVVAADTGVLSNDTLTQPASVTAFDAATTGGGTVAVAGDGSFVYTPLAGFNGVDSFTYTVTDAVGSATATVSILVALPASGHGIPLPTARDDQYPSSGSLTTASLTIAAGAGVLANDTLTPPATVTAFNAATSAGGTVVVASDGGFVYVPPAGLNGVDTFSYTVTDAGGSATATVSISVALPSGGGGPALPTARADQYPASGSLTNASLAVAAASGVLANDTLTQPATVTAFDVTSSSGGTVAVAPDGSFVYIPPAGLNGIDTFTYTVTDAVGSAKATVRISVALPSASTPSGSSSLGNDTLVSGDNNGVLDGDAETNTGSINTTGNDVVVGGAGIDRLVGDIAFLGSGTSVNQMGNDILSGGLGADNLFGDGVIANGTVIRSGDDLVNGGVGEDQMYGDFQLVSTTGQVTTCGNDVLLGGDNNDLLVGDVFTQNGTVITAGNDTLKGGNGDDVLYGDVVTNTGTVSTYGNDVLEGGPGDDGLIGDSESLTSGGGADAFVFSAVASFGSDRIRDYRAGEGDVVRFIDVTDVDGNGKIERADLDALIGFTVEAGDSNAVRVVVTSKSSSVVLGRITFGNIQFTGQTFDQLGLTVSVGS